MHLKFATRPSALARWQTQWVMQALQATHPGLICSEHPIITQGDKILDKSLTEIGGKGLFTAELENELLSGSVQVAVHSLKDLPMESSSGLMIAAIPIRGEARDTLVSPKGYTLSTLPEGAQVGTSSLRRAAQILALRPDLKITPLRGNVDTRLRKVIDGQYDAIILAGAGLERLGLNDHISEWMPLQLMLPAPGQGALAIQCVSNKEEIISLLASIDDPATRLAVTAERAFLYYLGGGCAVPVGAYGQIIRATKPTIRLEGLVASAEGSRIIRVSGTSDDPVNLGKELAEKAFAQGAVDILRGVRYDRQR